MAKYKPKSKWQEQKLVAVGISKFAFGLGLIISIGLTIYYYVTVGFVEYQDGLDYESGDRVTIYYPSDFQDGDWVESRNPKKIAQTLLFIFWGATVVGYLAWRSDKQEYDRLYKRKG